MWAMGTQEHVEFFANDRSLVSVFLSDGIDTNELKFIFEMWNGFNVHAEDKWHLLVPVKGTNKASVLNDTRNAKLYDARLAEQMREEYKIPVSDLPALVFEDFRKGTKKTYLSLADKSDKEIAKLVRSVLSIVREECKLGPEDVDEFRTRLLEQIDALAKKDKTFGVSLKMTAIAATVITIVSGLKSFM